MSKILFLLSALFVFRVSAVACEEAVKSRGGELVLKVDQARGKVILFVTSKFDDETSLEHAQQISESDMDAESLKKMLASPEVLSAFLARQLAPTDVFGADGTVSAIEPPSLSAMLGVQKISITKPDAIKPMPTETPRRSDASLERPARAYNRQAIVGARYSYYRPYR